MTDTQSPPASVSKARAAARLGLTVKRINELIEDKRLVTVHLEGFMRPRVTEASIRAVFQTIYGKTFTEDRP